MFSILLCAVLFCACNNDEGKTYIIKYVVRANTDSAIQMIFPTPEPIFWIKNYYECYDTIEEYYAAKSTYLECRCEDTVTIMTGEIYVNGELKAQDEAKSWLNVSCRFR